MRKTPEPGTPAIGISLLLHILFILIGVILASATFYFLEKNGYADDIRKYFFGNTVRFGEYSALVQNDWYKGIKTLMIMLVFFFILYSCFFVLFFEVVAVAYFIITSKWKKPAVFISYKNTIEGAKTDTTKIALSIKKFLEQKNFRVNFFLFNKEGKHDHVNFEIQNHLRRSDALIAIPDPYLPSYVDAEISCAVNAFKPVYIIKHTSDQQLPSTANSGHTVFSWNRLKKEKLKPMSYVLEYMHKVWHTRLFIVGYPLITFLTPLFIYGELSANRLALFLVTFGGIVAALLYLPIDIETVLLVLKIIISVIGVIAAHSTMVIIAKNIVLHKVIRQRMITAGSTLALFKEVGFDENVLKCIDKDGLVAKG